MTLIETMKQALTHEIDLVLTDPESKLSGGAQRALHYVHQQIQSIAEAGEQEIEPRFGQGISDNPYCNDADSNEPNSRAMRWHNKLLSLDAHQQPAPVQEVDWQDMYEKEKRRSAMWIAKYENDIGPLERATPQQEQGEPVAWGLAEKVRQDLDRQSCPDAFMRIAVESIVKHYTHPQPAQPKEWVGLTDEERRIIIKDWQWQEGKPYHLCLSIEAELKQKNTQPAQPKAEQDHIEQHLEMVEPKREPLTYEQFKLEADDAFGPSTVEEIVGYESAIRTLYMAAHGITEKDQP